MTVTRESGWWPWTVLDSTGRFVSRWKTRQLAREENRRVYRYECLIAEGWSDAEARDQAWPEVKV